MVHFENGLHLTRRRPQRHCHYLSSTAIVNSLPLIDGRVSVSPAVLLPPNRSSFRAQWNYLSAFVIPFACIFSIKWCEIKIRSQPQWPRILKQNTNALMVYFFFSLSSVLSVCKKNGVTYIFSHVCICITCFLILVDIPKLSCRILMEMLAQENSIFALMELAEFVCISHSDERYIAIGYIR